MLLKKLNNIPMNKLDDLGTYKGEPEHDSWDDFTYHENTIEIPEEFAEEDLDNYIKNLNDWD